MHDKQRIGFEYDTEEDLNQEFALAVAYFKKYPKEVMVSKQTLGKIYRFYTPPKHSYFNWNKPGMTWDDNHIMALSHGDSGYLVKNGQDEIKYGINQQGLVFAVKLRTADIKPALIVEEHTLKKDDIFSRVIEDKESSSQKSYQATVLLGQSMDKMIDSETITMAKKLDVARKSAWELHKLHENKIAHLDIQPGNIAIDENFHVTFFDFETAISFAESTFEPISTTPFFEPNNHIFENTYGLITEKNEPTIEELRKQPSSLFIRTSTAIYKYDKWEDTLVKKEFNQLDAQENARLTRVQDTPILTPEDFKKISGIKGLATKTLFGDIIKRKNLLGPMGCDVFAFKRTLYYPLKQQDKRVSLFTEKEYETLSPDLKQKLDTSYVSKAALESHKEDKAADLAFLLAEEKLSFILREKQPKISETQSRFEFPKEISQNPEHKKMVCQIFSLIDEIEEFKHGIHTQEKKQVVEQYLSSITNVKTPEALKVIQQELQIYQECMDLLSKIFVQKINKEDTTLDKYIQEQSKKLFSAKNTETMTIRDELQKALTAVSSQEVMAVKKEIKRLYQEAYKPSLFSFFSNSNTSMKKKAKEIESALIDVPVLQRGKAFSVNVDVQKTCAHKRFYLFYSGLKKEEVDEKNAAGTFQRIKNSLR